MKAFASFGAAVVGAALLFYRSRQDVMAGGASRDDKANDRDRHIIIDLRNGLTGPAYCNAFLINIGSSEDGTMYFNDICTAISRHINKNPTEIDLRIYNEDRAVVSHVEIKNMVEASSTLTVVLRERVVAVSAAVDHEVGFTNDAAQSGAGEGFVGDDDNGAAASGAGATYVDRLVRQRAASGHRSGPDLM